MNRMSILLASLLICHAFPNLPLPGASDAAAQEQPVTTTLLRRLAEAVDGDRTGRPLWVLAEYEFPNRVLSVRTVRDSVVADSVTHFRDLPDAAIGVFGPFTSPRDTRVTIEDLSPPIGAIDTIPFPFPIPVAGCIHLRWSSAMGNPMICPERMISMDLISSISLVYGLSSGDTITEVLPLDADAVFFSIPAIDKFVLPYYTRVLGVEEAARMRRRMLGRFIGH